MNFNEICELAESTRDEVYGLRVGSDRFGHDAVAFVKDIKYTGPKEKVETEHKKYKREKFANIEIYRKAMEESGEFSYDDAAHRNERQLNNNQLSFVAAGIKAGYIDPIDEDDVLDEN